jgi:hypothetical protein
MLSRGSVLRRAAVAAVIPFLAACGRSPSEPAESKVTLTALGDSVLFVSAGSSQPLRVAALHPQAGSAVEGVQVQWQVVEGAGSLASAQSTTDLFGVASTVLLPGQAGNHRVRATSPRITGTEPVLDVRVVAVPAITNIEPTLAAAGGEVTITGTNFSPTAAHNTVYFSGVRGDVLTATSTQLTVRVPACLPTKVVTVTAGLGSVISTGRPLSTTGGGGTTLDLQPGQVGVLDGAAAFSCVRLPAAAGGATYLLMTQNAANVVSPPMPFELRALVPGVVATPIERRAAPAVAPFAEAWEARLRERERGLPARTDGRLQLDEAASPSMQAVPVVGQEREFSVLNRSQTFDRIRATVRRVSDRAVLYVDVEAADAFSESDLSFFASIFDATIHPVTVATFGEPSDIDGNQRIFILFTPRVNALTPRNETSFITGFFYGCDLLTRRQCAGSNEAEVFYSLLPDPQGRWSSPRSQASVRNAVPPVLAHEFQHMIHFARRGFSADVLWLSEALAHTAEEVVGSALQSTDPVLAQTFQTGNYARAQRFLMAPAAAGVLAEAGPGTVEMRGAAWLLLKHVRAHHGGGDLLRRLTGSAANGVANLTQQTGQPWTRLLNDFGVAVWADGAPALAGPLDPRYSFGGFDLRAALATMAGGYTLRPIEVSWADFAITGSIAPGSQEYVLLAVPSGSSGAPLNFVFSGERGAPAAPAARLSVLRVR